MNNSIPVCYFPMRKIIIDDDSLFTDSVILTLPQKNFSAYNSPKEALKYLLQEYQPTFSKSDLISQNPEIIDSATQHAINIDIDKLKKITGNSLHNDINVLLIDYHMPEMKGVDFLNGIRHLPMKKVLITGEHDYKIGIDAFNSNLVDAYIRKDDPDFSTKLKNIVSELEWKYFTDLSDLIIDTPAFQYLKNTYLVDTFKNHLLSHDITSFCLTHTQGDFITYNAQNEKHHFLIRSKSQLEELAKIAEEDGGSVYTIESIKQGTMFPFFGDLECWQVPGSEWEKLLIPAIAQSNNELFWTTTHDTVK